MQFITAVHRRLMLLRVVEQFGLGMTIASVLAIIVVCIATWRSMPTFPVMMFCLALGLLIGVSLSIYRWPTRLAAAQEADRQLRLHDLLTTSMLLSTLADGFSQATVAMADARCRMHSPSEVVLRQWGIRGWSGAGLFMAVAATIAVIPLGSSRSQAMDTNLLVLADESIQTPRGNSLAQSHGPVAQVGDPISENSSSNAMTVEKSTEFSGNNGAISVRGIGSSVGSNGGSSTDAVAKSRDNFATARSSSSQLQSQTGTTAGGGTTANLGAGEAVGGTADARPRSSTPSANVMGQEQSTLLTSPTADNQIPAGDRDLVRDFFQTH